MDATTIEQRMAEVETRVQRLSSAPVTGSTPMVVFGILLGLVVFGYLVTLLPMPDGSADRSRVMLGAVSVVVGAATVTVALFAAKVLLRALVELLIVFLAFANALTCALAWLGRDQLLREVRMLFFVGEEHLVLATVTLFALALLALNVCVAIFIYPMAKVSGSDMVK